MRELIDLDRYPLEHLDSPKGMALLERCSNDLAACGLFNLDGLLTPSAVREAIAEVKPVIDTSAFTHRRRHNVYFESTIPGLAPEHPALRLLETVNHTICADQIPESILVRLYEWPPFATFLAAVIQKPELHAMADPLARVNVMAYRDGEGLNWHFDRAEFTTTLLLQAPEAGGDFQYRDRLRSDGDPNYGGVARLLSGHDSEVKALQLAPGTLNVFRGKYTAHRISPVVGKRERIIAILSYFERPGVRLSDEERLGFYGRAA